MTLFEVLIVVALIGLLAASLVFGSGLLASSKQRSAATMILSAVRVLQAHSTTTGRPARIVFDIDESTVSLEEAASSKMLRDSSPAGGAEAASALEQKARAETESILDGPKAPPPRFSPVTGARFGEGKPMRPLPSGIRFRQVQTAHDEEPVTAGRAYLYFWPGGETEEAAVQLTTGPEADGVTIRISALTGRARISRGRIDLPEPRAEDGFISEREE